MGVPAAVEQEQVWAAERETIVSYYRGQLAEAFRRGFYDDNGEGLAFLYSVLAGIQRHQLAELTETLYGLVDHALSSGAYPPGARRSTSAYHPIPVCLANMGGRKLISLCLADINQRKLDNRELIVRTWLLAQILGQELMNQYMLGLHADRGHLNWEAVDKMHIDHCSFTILFMLPGPDNRPRPPGNAEP